MAISLLDIKNKKKKINPITNNVVEIQPTISSTPSKTINLADIRSGRETISPIITEEDKEKITNAVNTVSNKVNNSLNMLNNEEKKQKETMLKLTEANANQKREEFEQSRKDYQKALSKEYEKRGVSFNNPFQEFNDKVTFENRNKKVQPTLANGNDVQEALKSVEEERQQTEKARLESNLAEAQKTSAKVENEDVNLWDKTGGVAVRALADLGSFVSHTDREYIDENGNEVSLPTYNELKQQKVSENYDTGVGKFLGDAAYNISKILGSTAINSVAPGVGTAIYWGDMFTDNYTSAINEGYDKGNALLYSTIGTGSEYLTGKFLGSATKGLTGGKTSELSKAISGATSKLIKNPQIANIIGSAGSEATEEFVQEYIGNINRLAVLENSTNAKDYLDVFTDEDVLKDALYSAGVGAISGGVTNIADSVRSNVNNNVDVLTNFKNQLEESKANATDKAKIETFDKAINLVDDYLTTSSSNEGQMNNTNEQNQGNTTQINLQQTTENGENKQLQNQVNMFSLNQTNPSLEKAGFINSARKYNLKVDSDTIQSINRALSDRGVRAVFDDTQFNNSNINALWRINDDGTRDVVFNPNANTKDLMENVAVHELYHDIVNQQGDNYLQNLVLDMASTKEGYLKARESLVSEYAKVYDTNNPNFNNIVNEEAVATILGEKLGNQEFINQLTTERRSVAKVVYDSIVSILNKLNKLTGYKSEKLYWTDVKNKFEKAYKNNNTNIVGQKNGTERFSIQTDPAGNKFVNIDTDQDIFRGKSLYEQTKIAKQYILDKFKGKELELKNDSVSVTRKTANEYTHPRNTLQKKDASNKMKASTELDNLLSISKYEYSQKDDGRHQFAKDGWDYYSTRFVINGNEYTGLLNIAKNGNKKMLYDITKLKRNTLISSPVKNTATESIGIPFSKNNISEFNQNVKSDTRYSMQQTEKNAKRLDNSSFFVDENISNNHKSQQLDIINSSNPMQDDYHTGIRSVDDIKTFREAFNEAKTEAEEGGWSEYASYPDITNDIVEEALNTNEITVYSSNDIKNGTFVTPSYIQALEYAGNDSTKVKSKKVNLDDIAWINLDEGQYAKVKNNKSNSKEVQPLEKRVSGDDLLDAQDLIDELKNVNAEVDDNGYVTVYHQTSEDNAKKIRQTGKMFSKEQAVFFSTSKDAQQSNGRGPVKLKFKIPVEKLKLDDIFSDNADVRIDLDANKFVDISFYITNDDIRYSKENKTWNDFVEKHFKNEGTGKRLQDLKENTITRLNSKTELNENKQEDVLTIKQDNNNAINETLTNSKGDGESKFYRNITERSEFLTQENRDKLSKEDYIKHYDTVSNEESMNKALDRLNDGGEAELNRWFAKGTKGFDKYNPKDIYDSTDVAEGWILLKRAQDNGDYDMMVEVAKKMREIGTTSGQTVQMYNLLARLTPEGMVKYATSQLDEAWKIASKNKSKSWVDKYAQDFQLTPDETEYIVNQMQKVEKMPDGRAKTVEIAKVQKMLQDKLPPLKGQAIKAWMRISMLFNPKTQVRNVVGNAGIAPVNVVADTFASIADRQIAKRTGVRTTGNTNIKNYAKGFKKGLIESYEDFKLGVNTRNIQGNRFELGEGKSFNEHHKGFLAKPRNNISKGLNRLDSLLSFVLDAGDRGFYEASFVNSINNQMTLNKTSEVTQDMIDVATNEALSRTWQDNNNYTKFVLDIRRGMNKISVKGYGLGDVLIPFAKTPANLTKAIVDYSPVGLVKTLTSDAVKLNNNIKTGTVTIEQQHRFVQNLGKATAGTMLYVAGMALAQAGITSGANDDDKDVSDFMKNTLGIQPYSVKIGNHTFTYDWAQPVAAPFAITADITRALNSDDVALKDAITTSLDSGFNILLEQSFLSGIQNVLNTSYGSTTENIIDEVLGLPARAVPTFIKQINDMIDPKTRMTFENNKTLESAKNQVKTKIPGLSDELPVKRDTLGREIEKYGGENNVFNIFFNPANISKGKVSESAKEIYDVYQATKDKTIMPRSAPNDLSMTITKKDGTKKKKELVLDNKDKSEFLKISGGIVDKNVKKLKDNKHYKKLNDDEKALVIKEIVDYSYNKAKADLLDIDMSEVSGYKTVTKKLKGGMGLYDYYAQEIYKNR